MPAKDTKKEQVATAKSSSEDGAPSAADLGGAARQLVMLPVLWASNKIDFTDEQNLMVLRVVFTAVMLCGYIAITVGISKVKRRNDTGRVQEPGVSMYLKDEDKAADGSVSIRTYDNAKLQEAKMQFVMSAAIGFFMHAQWGYTQPLVIMSIMQPMQLFDNKALAVHLRGASGEGYERPFKANNAGNPLAQWAEKKKAEQEAASKAKRE